MREQEHNLQVSCVEWFRFRFPKALIFAIPNGGHRDVRVAVKMKAEGVTAGVPDLCVPMSMHGYHALYIEMKNGKAGRVSDAQRSVMDKLRDEGNKCVVCRSFDEFRAEVESYMSIK